MQKYINYITHWMSNAVGCQHLTGRDGVGIVVEEVGMKYYTDKKQLLCVNGRFVEQALQGALGDSDSVHQPFVGVTLAAEFVSDKGAYVYLHSSCYLCAWLPNPHNIPTTANKKEGEQSRLQLAVVENYLQE